MLNDQNKSAGRCKTFVLEIEEKDSNPICTDYFEFQHINLVTIMRENFVVYKCPKQSFVSSSLKPKTFSEVFVLDKKKSILMLR